MAQENRFLTVNRSDARFNVGDLKLSPCCKNIAGIGNANVLENFYAFSTECFFMFIKFSCC